MTEIDASGKVATPDGFWTVWSDLSPFAQGYVEALFASLREGDLGYLSLAAIRDLLRFDRLAPETLSRIIADCEVLRADLPGVRDTKHDGRKVWEVRQNGEYRSFPRLRVVNGDGDKVVFL